MKRWGLAFCLALVALVLSPAVGAMDRVFHPDLDQAVNDLRAAESHEAYAVLREIWSTWNRADPRHVEEALLAASDDRRLTPPVRSYAGTLHAYARLRRGDDHAAASELGRLGYVDRWLVVGPFDNEAKTGLSQAFGPELELTEPIVPGRAFSGKERPVRWRQVPQVFRYGWLDFGALLRPETKVCGYARTFVTDADQKHRRSVSVWVGAGGAFELFWNSKHVLEDEAYRGHDPDRAATNVWLEPGPNQLTVKVCSEQGSPVVSVRVAGPDGSPDPELEFDNRIETSERAAQRLKEQAESDAGASIRQRVEGPLQAFQRLVPIEQTNSLADAQSSEDTDQASLPESEIDAKPSVMFEYAKYLHRTGGDDPTQHLARDLARRAAEDGPQVERALLAAKLAEDRNKARVWLDKAQELAQEAGTPSIELLLARASLAQASPTWRKAFPYYERVLAQDPDNVEALFGRVELYNRAGLPRTALRVLERGVERNPHSVLLLNGLASQLSSLGRSREAALVEQRYFARRADDRSYIGEQIQLALARRDQDASEHWVQRLIDLDPSNIWSLERAASAYRQMGQTERAVATLEQALELAPEDVGTIRALADLQAETGHRDQQLALLKELLKIRPQERDVREYIEHIETPEVAPDEKFAWKPERFLPLRHAPAGGYNRRTLRDLTVSTVFENGLSSKFRQVVFQPLTDAAAAAARQYSFVYEADTQRVQLRGARIFRGDGRVDEAIEWGEAAANDPSISMYTSARAFYIQLPRLEPGDVVELRWRIDDTTPRNEFKDYFGEITYLQDVHPVANAEYVLVTPKSRKIYVDEKIKGVKRKLTESKDQRTYRFFADKIAPMRQEPAMPPLGEELGFVHVSTYESWKALGQWYWGLVREQFDLDDETRKLAREITKDAKTDLEKVKAVYGWVVQNTRYVALEFGIYGYKPRRCVQTVSRGWGDCKDKATVIVTLLKELGIDATIVILRTQMRGGFNSELPSLAPFDHAIAYVPSLDLYLDGTAEFSGATELPVMDLEALGLLVNEGDAKLVRLPGPNPEKNWVKRTVAARVDESGAAQLQLSYQTTGPHAADWRRRYHAKATQRERINADLGREFPGFELAAAPRGVKANDLENIEEPVQLDIRGRAPGFARAEGDHLSMAVTPRDRLTSEYASLSKRTQDVRLLGFVGQDETYEVRLPPGSSIISGPEPTSVDTPFGRYSIEVDKQGNKVTVHSKLQLKVTRVKPKDYAAFRKFCEDLDSAFTPRLVVAQ